MGPMQTSFPQTLESSKTTLTDRGFQWSAHLQPVTGDAAGASQLRTQMDPSRQLSASDSQAFNLPLDVSSRFGMRLRELRRERNLTQLRMANEFGIDRSFISDVERGRKSISLPMLEVIALGMKISLSELLRDI